MGKIVMEGLTFDDVLLIPKASSITPDKVSLKTKLTENIELNIPILSAAMDTVTESNLAIELAKIGGLGFIHKNMTIERQAEEILKVKNHLFNIEEYKNACIDKNGKLRVGAAVGIGSDTISRIEKLVEAGVDIITVDSAHGHSIGVVNKIREIRDKFKNLELIGGNIVTKEAAKDLIEAGVNALKVGVGPGSICTTRVVAGVGVPQLTAIMEVYEYAKEKNVKVIADGGIKLSGDIVKAIGAGANTVMLGSLLASSLEAPGVHYEYEGKKYKSYVGMGSLIAMERGSKDRYFQLEAKTNKLVPEGIESMVEIKGKLSDIVFQLCGGLRAGMGYTGAKDIETLIETAEFVKITSASLKESHPHDVIIIKDAPNYSKK